MANTKHIKPPKDGLKTLIKAEILTGMLIELARAGDTRTLAELLESYTTEPDLLGSTAGLLALKVAELFKRFTDEQLAAYGLET